MPTLAEQLNQVAANTRAAQQTIVPPFAEIGSPAIAMSCMCGPWGIALLITGARAYPESSSALCDLLCLTSIAIGSVLVAAILIDWFHVLLVLTRCVEYGHQCGWTRWAKLAVGIAVPVVVFVGSGIGMYIYLVERADKKELCDSSASSAFETFFIVCMILVVACLCCIPCTEFTVTILDGEDDACACEAFLCNSDVHQAAGYTWSGDVAAYRVDYNHYLGRAAALVGIARLPSARRLERGDLVPHPEQEIAHARRRVQSEAGQGSSGTATGAGGASSGLGLAGGNAGDDEEKVPMSVAGGGSEEHTHGSISVIRGANAPQEGARAAMDRV